MSEELSESKSNSELDFFGELKTETDKEAIPSSSLHVNLKYFIFLILDEMFIFVCFICKKYLKYVLITSNLSAKLLQSEQ